MTWPLCAKLTFTRRSDPYVHGQDRTAIIRLHPITNLADVAMRPEFFHVLGQKSEDTLRLIKEMNSSSAEYRCTAKMAKGEM